LALAIKPATSGIRLPKLYAIIDAETCARQGITAPALAQQLHTGGVRLVQYRDKLQGPAAVLETARRIAEVFAADDCTFLLNDRADLAALLGCGVHVGQEDLSVADARLCVGERAVGVSTHSVQQFEQAADTDADYIALGPVFSTMTKQDAAAVVGLDLLRALRPRTQKPIVAIGGITLTRAAEVMAAGADSVAVIGGFFIEGMTVADAAREYLLRLE
jgi:thiamine-phosphate pyrophosphorylase